MRCIYINLDHATRRRADIEASFSAAVRPGWHLERFRALDAAGAKEHAVEGGCTWAEKACFMSHRAAIQRHAGNPEHLLVVEDDTTFGIATFDVVDGFLQQNVDADWDLLFLDVGLIDIVDMMKFYFNREKLVLQRKVVPLDLARLCFFGANAYIVNRRSFGKVLGCLEWGMPVDMEYDLFLSRQVGKGLLNAAVLFPFLTTVSRNANVSQIQRASIDTVNLARNVFRNMMWLESIPAKFEHDLARLDARIAASGHASMVKVMTAICHDYDDPGFNSDPL
nr:glycosyltransferase family 25 protein [uncultured Noviherbaspirillum sp.]